MSSSNIVDLSCLTEGSNMYGCQPCPKCGSKYRVMYNDAEGLIRCDDCGFNEPGIEKTQ